MAKKRNTAIAAVLCIIMALTACAGSEEPEKDSDSEHYKELEDIEMASATVTMSDGSKAVVKLNMTSGIYYDEYYEGYLPSIYTYDQNYEGSYELLTMNESGDVLFRVNLDDLWPDNGNTYNFRDSFELEWTDYNADGCPDFSIGMPYSSSSMGFLILTVLDDGSIERLSDTEILLDSFEKFSVIFEHDQTAEGKPVTGYRYNNVSGEIDTVTYYYNEDSGLYEEE